MRETLHNQRFNDIYFSPEDGLAETHHVFIEGNKLSQRLADKASFTIVETGFGTGLNFLATLALFKQVASKKQRLDYISYEKYPLSSEQIINALEPFKSELGSYIDLLAFSYPLRITGYHRIRFGNVHLTLIFDDVNIYMKELQAPRGVDAWYLDGFSPAKNPEMWTDEVFTQMARLSNNQTSLATFTVAGKVRRGLEQVGFKVEKAPGFGRKKDMCIGRFQSIEHTPTTGAAPKKIAVIGGGLAGSSCAYLLAKQGISVSLFEKEGNIAKGASGNSVGLYNPRFFATRSAGGDFYNSAYALGIREFKHISNDHNIELHPCGSLHVINNTEKQKRFEKVLSSALWHKEHMSLLDPEQSSNIAGINVSHSSLYLPDSGYLSPIELCKAYTANCEVVPSNEITDLNDKSFNVGQYDAVIIANSSEATKFKELSYLPIYSVRGQITTALTTPYSQKLQCSICYGGYLSSPVDGVHFIGSTFKKWETDTHVTEEDHEFNMAKLCELDPDLASSLNIVSGRASLRSASKDRTPLIGRAYDEQGVLMENTYLSLAHGSHGILSSIAGAQLITDQILGSPVSLSSTTIAELNPRRFYERSSSRASHRY